MKAINYLRQIKVMDAKINSYIEQLGQLETMATKTTSVFGDERVQSSSSQQKMSDCVAKIVDMKNQITDEIDKFIDYKKEAMEILSTCDAECINLIYKRYFMFETWEQIAVDMEYTYQWVSGGLHKKALMQFQRGFEEKESCNGRGNQHEESKENKS